MVAYSFKRRFVPMIQYELGILPAVDLIKSPDIKPKTHTIRAHRKHPSRHARPDDPVTLWCEQRSGKGFRIGASTCDRVRGIRLNFRDDGVAIIDASVAIIHTADGLDDFAVSDGFGDWAEMRAFWREQHDGVLMFEGVIVDWRPGGSR